MKLNKNTQKIGFVLIMLMFILTVFCINMINLKSIFAEEIDSSKLSKLSVINYEGLLNPEFDSEIYEYNISISEKEIDLFFDIETIDNDATYKIENNRYIKNNTGIVKITVSEPNSEDTIYIINYVKEDPNKFANVFDYTGDSQTFTALNSGIYRIELWGGEGGDSSFNTYSNVGGKGAYTKGDIYLEKDETLYVYVGGKGATFNTSELVDNGKGYNGGGPAYYASGNSTGGGGGGATDIRLVDGTWSTTTSLISRIMVAAGGGGSKSHVTNGISYSGTGGAGGTLTGKNAITSNATCYAYGTGASQTTGGTGRVCSSDGRAYTGISSFGYGINSLTSSYYVISSSAGYAGGGGGYYGGGVGYHAPAGGGSSYISGYLGSVAVSSNASTAVKDGCTDGTDDITCSYHYSNKIFSNAVMLSGDDEVPTHDGTDVMTGNAGNGYAKISLVPINNYLSALSSTHGTFDKEFDPTVTEYNLTIGQYDEQIKIEATALSDNAIVSGTGYYNVENGKTETINISVTSETGDIKIYTINVIREALTELNNSKLKSLKVEKYELEPKFDPLITEYNINVLTTDIDLKIISETFDKNAVVEIKGNEYIYADSGIVTITVSASNIEDTIYVINFIKIKPEKEYIYEYIGDYQEFLVPVSGKYKIELWGAAGGAGSTGILGGNGAYTSGIIDLNYNDKLYLYVGQKGNVNVGIAGGAAAFNGGGEGGSSFSSYIGGSSGGGATDIRLTKSDLKSRIMVAAGGGGSGFGIIGGYAGALTGGPGKIYSGATVPGATQTSGYLFGIGEKPKDHYAYYKFGAEGNGGGGGGYYGGHAHQIIGQSQSGSGSGGSSYISGNLGSVAITSQTDISPKDGCLNETEDITCSYHYSNNIFKETIMLAGNEDMPTYDGTGIMVGNSGNGYAKITPIMLSNDNYLTELTSDYGTLSPSFDPVIENYTLTLDKYYQNFTLSGTLSNELSIVTGLGTYGIEVGETKEIKVIVTSESGNIRTYTITAIRENLKDNEHSSKLKKLETNEFQLDLTPEFHPLTTEYDLTILKGEINVDLITEVFDEEAIVTITGNKFIKEDIGVITIKVSEPNCEDTIYTINYIKNNEIDINEFDYTGNEQTYIAPTTRYYKLETWGAQGGGNATGIRRGGFGAYSTGIVKLTKNEKLYINVGGSGTVAKAGNVGGYNGGGTREHITSSDSYLGTGGGATHIATVSGLLSTLEEYKGTYSEESGTYNSSEILIVSGGGGGSYSYNANYYGYGGDAGGINGGKGYSYRNGSTYYTTPSTQNSGHAFGQGINGDIYISGGGAGWYGGLKSSNNSGGGSSFIGSSRLISFKDTTKSMYCYSCTESTNPETYTVSTTNISTDPVSEYAKQGAGYAKITPIIVSKDNYLTELSTNLGILSPKFDPIVENYTLTLGKYDQHFTLNGVLSDKLSTVEGLGYYEIEAGETKKINIIVTSESGDIKTYTINAIRENFADGEHTSKLKKLETGEFQLNLTPEFHPLTTEYDLTILNGEVNVDLITEVFDEEAIVAITGNKFIKEDIGVITITVSEPNCEDTIYTINYIKNNEIDINEFDYTGDEQTYIAPITGYYKLETWGAQGGGNATGIRRGGFGAYSTGIVKLTKNEKLYINVGGSGTAAISYNKGGYNGGGTRENVVGSVSYLGTGGGATHIATVSGLLSELEEYKGTYSEESGTYNSSEILIVSGGGGGSYSHDSNYYGYGGDAGGINGGQSYTYRAGSKYYSSPSTQNTGYSFGKGADGRDFGSAGGGGWYGGLTEANNAGGGSSFIGSSRLISFKDTTKSMYCYSCTESSDSETYTVSTTNISTDPVSEYAKQGAGYAKITPILLSKDNYLLSIVTDKGILDPVFDPTTEEYNIELGVEDTKIKISARPSSDLATIEGLGEHDVPGGKTTFPIVVTAESGETRTYNINVTRPSSDDSKAKNIEITGLVPSICEGHIGYCELDTEFDPYKGKYYITVPAGIRELEFTVIKNHDYQTVTGDGVSRLKGGDNEVTLEVISEDGQSITTYSYEIYRDMTGNNYIDKLEIINPKIDIGFDYLITEYVFKVENDVTSLEMNVELDDPNATFRIIGNENFVVGNNIVEVEVTAANGEIRNYILNVYRVSNSNPLLLNLEVVHGETVYTLSPEFEDIKMQYTLSVENEVDKVQVNATAQVDTTTISGTGSYDLKTGLNQIKVMTTAESGDVETYTIIITRAKNSNNYLSTLTANEGAFNETFDKTVENYTMTVNPYVKSLNLTYTKEASTSSVSISGNSNFKIGENLVTIKVTSEDRSIRYYYITVTKEGSDNNYLSSLTVNKGTLSPTFNKETLLYNVEVENEISAITISGEKEDILSKVNGFGTYVLTSGENTITVRVTSETGITRDYVINVFRKLNADATLRNITLSSGELNPAFDKDTLEYTVNVENEVEKITVRGIPNVNTTTVEGNNTYTLSVGSNQIELNTISENQTKLTYKINVIRNQSSNANLSYLMVKEGIMNPAFDKNTVNYTVKVLNETENITVEYKAEKETSTVVVTGGNNLVVGENEVNVIVTSEDGTVKTYYLTVIRLDESLSNLNLKTLDVTSCTLNPEFSPSIGYYECEVEYEISSVIVSAQMEDETNTLSGTGKHNLSVGQNVIGVSVSNDLGIEKGYNVVITRKESEEVRLKNISVKNHVLNETYNPDIFEYTLTTEEDSLEFVIEKMHEDQTVEINGNENFVLGENTITITVTNAAKTNTSTYVIKVTKEKSTNNYLSNLYVDGYEISPTFNKGTMEYTLTVENEIGSVIVNGEPEKITSSVSGFGMHTLQKGLNEIIVIVTSETGLLREYKINVTRLGSRNSNLSSLSVKDHSISPEFSKEVKEYELEVEYEVSEIEIIATPEEENSRVSGDGIISLQKGLNELDIVVTSENGEISTYKLNVTRKDPVTSLLENIKVTNYNLDKEFTSEVLDYIVVIDNEVTSLDLIITKLDPNSTYEIIGNENFEVGLNEVQIISTSSNKVDQTTYTLTVNRQAYSNTYLSALSVSEGSLNPEFNKTTLTYTVEVAHEVETIIVGATAENQASTVSGTGNYTLKEGLNEIKVKVTSLGGITRTYNVNVIRRSSANANVTSISTNIGTLTKLNDISYKLVVPKETEKITSENIIVTTEDIKAQVEKMSELQLSNEEENRYVITVTSPDKTLEKEYIIYVEYELSNDATLKSLTSSVGTLTPEFNSKTEEYTLNVLDTETEVELFAEVNDENSNILTENLVYELNSYTTIVEIIVEAQDGNIKIYKVNIEKSITTERYLQNIEITKVTDECESCVIPKYSETTYEYQFSVPYEVSEIGFDITKKHPNQKVIIYKNNIEVTEYKLDVGENIFVVQVENGIGNKTTYTYNIERLESTNNYLSSLKLISPEYIFTDFDKEKLEYSVQIPYEYENIVVQAIAEDSENATISIRGTTYLIEGNNDVSIKVRSASGEIRTYIIHVLRTPESNNLLQALTISSGDIYTLTPKFTPGVTEYTLSVPSTISKVSVEGLPEEETTVVEGNGEYDLNIGLNEIIIKSTSLDGISKEYKIAITRLSSKIVYLSNLEVRNGTMSPEFNKERGIYDVEIENTVNKLDMIIELEDPNATYEVIGNENLRYGLNEVKIKVTSSDKTAAKTYVLNVNKKGEGNNKLLSISVDGEAIEGFDPLKSNYEIVVENNKSSVAIDAEAESEYARINGLGVYSLLEGENTINVSVEAQNGEIRIYTLRIIRKLNTYLSAIVTDEGELNPDFDKLQEKYSIEVENDVKEITVIGLKDSVSAEVTGNGKYTLPVGTTTITLTVTNGEYTRSYVIDVTRKGSENTYLEYLTVAEGIMSPVFDKETEEYTIYIPDDKTSVTLDYKPEDESSTVEVIGNENMTLEENSVIVRVTSTSGKVRDYNLKVIREDAALFSNRLLSLSVNRGTLAPKFDPDINEYTVTVTNSTEEIVVSAIRESVESTVIGTGTHKLVVGRNVIQVLVISKDNKQRIYTLIVYRNESNDARLSELEFNEGYLSPIFNKNRFAYTLVTESDAKYITVKKLVPIEENATYEITKTSEEVKTGNVININVTSPDGSTTKTYTVTLKVEKSSNANLSELTSSVGQLVPEFNKGTYTYSVDVGSDVNSIIISAKAESEKAVVSGTGLYELHSGENVINITVTAENGSSNVYSVIVNKEKSNNNNLKELYIRGYNFDKEFNKDTLEYSVTVPNDVEKVNLEGTLEDRSATVLGLGEYTLSVGENEAKVIVTAEDGSIKTYKVLITREEIKSSKIRKLEVLEGELNPEFVSETYEYYVNIPNEYTSITPVIELEESTATYEVIGNKDFIVGENKVQIKVTSSTGEISTYVLHVIRDVSSNNYLKIITVNKGTLTPEFDKNELNYQVILPNTEDTITVSALPEATTTIVRGIGTYNLKVGENLISLYSESESGVKRTYKIKVIREGKNNNNLSNIIVSDGTLTPAFDKDTLNYEVNVEEGLEEIEITGTLEDETATLSGDGTIKLSPGENIVKLTVTSETGEIKVYEVKVNRTIGTSTNIISMTPSSGTLSPEFSNEITDYTINVDKTVNVMNFDIILESKTSKVTGHENIIVNGKETTAVITVTAEDGTTKEITVTIKKESSIEKIEVEKTNIILPKGEEYQIVTKVTPSDITNIEYEYTSQDDSIASVDENGKVTAKEIGEVLITVKVKGEDVSSQMTVTVVNNLITSDIYNVEEKETEKIIIGADEGETLKDFIDKLSNEESMINIYDKEGNLIQDKTQVVKTGLIVKLELEGKVYDEAIIIVRGDLNEDGIIDVSDKVSLLNHILLKNEITDYRIYACDVEEDDVVDVSDKVKLVNYILRKISTLN